MPAPIRQIGKTQGVLEPSARPHVLSIVLAGGEGKRLAPLTLDRAKPAVPFGGHYRLIDFALSNLANGGYRKIVVSVPGKLILMGAIGCRLQHQNGDSSGDQEPGKHAN